MRAAVAKLQLCVGLAVFLLALVSCQAGGGARPQPVISSVQTGADCRQGDHAYGDAQLGWAFCYPGTWRFNERFQRSDVPAGTDATFDVINEPPCASPPEAGARPVCPPDSGLFGFMIVGTYQRGSAASLADWLKASAPGDSATEPISWGNAVEAVQVKGTTRRYALTQHQVVLLDLRSGAGNLDLDAAMSGRLSSWNFSF
jgi:hypothetical protein